MKKITRHLQHYLPLIGILSAGILGFMIFSYDKSFQLAVALAMAAGYVSWGLVHHYMHKDLHPEVILEYIVMAFLGLVLIFSVILRG